MFPDMSFFLHRLLVPLPLSPYRGSGRSSPFLSHESPSGRCFIFAANLIRLSTVFFSLLALTPLSYYNKSTPPLSTIVPHPPWSRMRRVFLSRGCHFGIPHSFQTLPFSLFFAVSDRQRRFRGVTSARLFCVDSRPFPPVDSARMCMLEVLSAEQD